MVMAVEYYFLIKERYPELQVLASVSTSQLAWDMNLDEVILCCKLPNQ